MGKYADIIAEVQAEEDKKRARAAGLTAPEVDPDAMGRAMKVAEARGLPTGVVADNLPDYDQEDHLAALDAAASASPALARWLGDPNQSALAKDDVSVLSSIGHQFNSGLLSTAKVAPWLPLPQSALDLQREREAAAKTGPQMRATAQPSWFTELAAKFQSGWYSGKQGASITTDPFNPVRMDPAVAAGLGYASAEEANTSALGALTADLGRQAQAADRESAATMAGFDEIAAAEKTGSTGNIVKAVATNPRAVMSVVAQSLGMTAPQLALGAAMPASRVMAGITAGTGSFAVENGMTILDVMAEDGVEISDPAMVTRFLRDKPAMARARAKALKRGVAVGTFDALTAGFAGRLIANSRRSFASVATRVAGEGGLQGVGGATGEAAAQLVTEGKITSQSDVILEAAAEVPTFLAEGRGQIAQARRAALHNADRFDAAQEQGSVDRLVKLAGESKTRGRSASRFESLIQDMAAEGEDTVYLSADGAQKLFQSAAGVEGGPDLAGLVDGDALREAIATGGEVAIPLAKYATMVTPELHAGVADQVRLQPGGRHDLPAVSPEEIQAAITAGMAEARDNDARENGPAGQVYDDIYGQLLTKQDDTAARQNASVVQSVYRNLAERTGTDAWSLYQQFRINIPGATTDNRGKRKDIDLDVDPLLDAIRSGQLPSDREIYGDSLVSALHAAGGLRDSGGELANMDAAKSRPGLVNNLAGMTLDNAVMWAYEEGFINAPTNAKEGAFDNDAPDISTLLDMLGQDLGGDPVYRMNEMNPERARFRESAEQLSEELDAKGIDLSKADNAGVRRALGLGPTLNQPPVNWSQVDTPEFERWSGGADVIEADAMWDYKGGPAVFALYHGTTADFDAFDRSKANPESDMGAGFYFTNTTDDVGNNYAGLGPDLKGKIERDAERIASGTDREYDDPEVVAEARARWLQNDGATVPVYVRAENPAVVGGPAETQLTYEENYDEETEEFDEPDGTLLPVIDALRGMADNFDDVDGEAVVATVLEKAFDNGGLSMSELINLVKESEGAMYAMDQETGDMAVGEYIRQALEEAGYDAIVDYTVDQKFGSQRESGQKMAGMQDDTVHVIAFEPTQIKSSIGNRGTFDPNDPRIDYAMTDLLRGPSGRAESAATRQLIEQAVADGDLTAMLKGIAAQEGIGADQAALATRLAEITPDLNVTMVPSPADAHAAGIYNNGTNEIWIHQALPSVVLHEVLHGVTSAMMTSPTLRKANPGVAKAVTEFNDLLAAAQAHLAASDIESLPNGVAGTLNNPNGPLSNIKELLTYGMTDKPFQDWLATVPAPVGREDARTGWQWFKDTIASLLGITDAQQRSALDALIESTADLVDFAQANPQAVNFAQMSEAARTGRVRDQAEPTDPTGTDSFKAWFGDSKVVGPGGKPLVVYHGAPDARFAADDGIFKSHQERFGQKSNGKDRAFWFAKSRRVAASYADDRRAFDYQAAEPGVIAAYVKLENPLVVDGEGKPWREAQARGKTSDVMEEARTAGHDGVIIKNVIDNYNDETKSSITDTYVAFSSEQIKSATGNSGAFDPNNPSILYQSQPVFRSALLEAVEAAKGAPKKGDAKAWSGWLDGAQRRGDIKQAERDWLGLDDWIKSQGDVTRDQLAEYVRANQVRVQDVTLGDGSTADAMAAAQAAHNRLVDAGFNVDMDDYFGADITTEEGEQVNRDDLTPAQQRDYDLVVEAGQDEPTDGDVKFGGYQLPGGENYRELLLTLPATDEGFRAWMEGKGLGELTDPFSLREWRKRYDADGFQSGHFDQPNILAHVRFNERTDSDGAKVLFIEEIQSDWHQAGRKRGYLGESMDAWVARVGATTRPNPYGAGFEAVDRGGRMIATGATTGEAIQDGWTTETAPHNAVPNAPFKNTNEWAMLAFKRMVRHASENGFDKIAWTTGEQQADRYDLSKQVDSIEALRNADGTYSILGEPVGGGRTVPVGREIKESDLADAVGKDLADKIIAQGDGEHSYSGAALKVGGEGMAAFYDKILPSAVNKWGKKFGARVGDTWVRTSTAAEVNADADLLEQLDQDVSGIARGKDGGQTVHAIDLTPAMRDAALEGLPMFQGGKKDPRGSVTFGGKAGARQFNIELLAGMDASTFMHEMGHVYLEVLNDLAAREGAPQQITDDLATIDKWLGREPGKPITTDQHEQFARGWEAYLREGKAPSSALRRAFASFKVWLTAIYRSIRTLDVDLTDDVRGVMDRIVASDAEVADARGEQYQEALITDAMAVGMSPEDFEAYNAAVTSARADAEATVAAEVLLAERREEKAWYVKEKRKVRDQVLAEIRDLPVYRAQRLLRNGKLPNGDDAPEALRVKLSKDELLDKYGQSFLRNLHGMYSVEGGVRADEAAALYGFGSGRELIDTLVNAPKLQDTVNSETDARMKSMHPDPMTDGTLPDRAMIAAHRDRQADMMVREIRALETHVGGRAVSQGAVIKGVAKQIIQEKKLRHLQPATFKTAEARAGREAFQAAAKQDWPTAVAARRRQLLNFELFREAVRARDEAASMSKYLAKFGTTKVRARLGKAGGDYLDQVDALLDRFDFRKISDKASDRRASLAAWVEKKAAAGIDVNLSPKLLDEAFSVPYREMTVGDLRSLRDAVKAIDHLARLKGKLLLAGEIRDAAEIDQAMAESLRESNPERAVTTGDRTKKDKIRQAFQQGRVLQGTASDIARELDGYKDMGAIWRNTVGVMREAVNNQVNPRLLKARTELADVYTKHYTKAEIRAFSDRVPMPEVNGDLWSKSRLLSLALNWGNEGNREAILTQAKARLTQDQVAALLGRLDARDWAFVEDVWQNIDSHWPAIAEAQKRRTGLVPERVVPSAFTIKTSDGKTLSIPGGYYPLKYEGDSVKTMKDEADDFYNSIRIGRTAKASTKDGHTIERVGSGGRTVRLDTGVIQQHLRDVIRDVYLGDAVNYVHNVLNGQQFKEAVDATGTQEYRQSLEVWLKDAAAGEIGPRVWHERAMRATRQNFTAAVLTYKMTSALLQLSGVIPTSVALGSRATMGGIAQYLGKPIAMTRYVRNASPYMEARAQTHIEAVQVVMDAEAGRFAAGKSAMIRMGYWMIARVQQQVDMVTWLAAESAGMTKFGGDVDQARAYADDVVARAQGSGEFIDKSPMQRGTLGDNVRQTEWIKAVTMLQGYMIAKGNLAYEQTKKANLRSPRQAMKWMSDMVMLFSVEGLLTAALTFRLPGDDDDDGDMWDDLGEWVAKDTVATFFGSIPGGGVMVDQFRGYDSSGVIAGAWRSYYELLQQLKPDEDGYVDLDKAVVTSAVKVGGVTLGLPSTQINKTVEAIATREDGYDVSPLEYITGPKKESKK